MCWPGRLIARRPHCLATQKRVFFKLRYLGFDAGAVKALCP